MRNTITVDATVIERWQGIEAAAQALIARIDQYLAQEPWPLKYRVPWGEANALRAALQTMPHDLSPLGKIPPGPREARK